MGYTLEQAIMMLEDKSVRREMCHRFIKPKNKKEQMLNEHEDFIYRKIIKELKQMTQYEWRDELHDFWTFDE